MEWIFLEKDISKNATDEYSGFSEFITNGEAIDREQQVKDKFNGILYHIIPTYNQINILFSTKGLYTHFIYSLKNYFQDHLIRTTQFITLTYKVKNVQLPVKNQTPPYL